MVVIPVTGLHDSLSTYSFIRQFPVYGSVRRSGIDGYQQTASITAMCQAMDRVSVAGLGLEFSSATDTNRCLFSSYSECFSWYFSLNCHSVLFQAVPQVGNEVVVIRNERIRMARQLFATMKLS